MKPKYHKGDLVQYYQNMMTVEIVKYIKYLKQDEKLSIPRLYARLIEKYPQFKVRFEGEKFTKHRRIEGGSIYAAAKNYDKNCTKLEVWQRW